VKSGAAFSGRPGSSALPRSIVQPLVAIINVQQNASGPGRYEAFQQRL
jgi:hypothetical protein